MLALVGESGCGKTSTAQSVLRLIQTSGGSIRFDGREITELSSKELRPLRRRMQIVYQDHVSRSTRASASERRSRSRSSSADRIRAERREEVKRALELAWPDPRRPLHQPLPARALGGPAAARRDRASLVLHPELLVADEPVSMLDVSVRAGILSILDELRDNGLAVLMMHDLSTAAYADRIAVMYLGRIVEEGPTREVIETRSTRTRALLSVVPKQDPRSAALLRSFAARRRTRCTSRPAAASTHAARWRSRSARRWIPSSGGRPRGGTPGTSPPASGSRSPSAWSAGR